MARPRKDALEPSAQERIEVAFWELLSEMPLSKITIRGISQRAHVNPNTFYRHYENTYNLALCALGNTITPQMAKQMANVFEVSDPQLELDNIDEFEKRFAKLVSFARCDSLELQHALASKIMKTWLEAYDIEETALSSEEYFDLNVLFKIVVTILGDKETPLTSALLGATLQRDLGTGMKLTLVHILEHHSST